VRRSRAHLRPAPASPDRSRLDATWIPGPPIVRAAAETVQTGRPDLTDLHQLMALAIVAATVGLLVAAAWSVVAGRRSGGGHDHRFAVDRLLLVVEGLLVLNGALGAAFVVTGLRPADALHLLYGPAAILTLPIGWAVGARRRPDGSPSRLRRDVWLLAATAILLGLLVRLFMTG
jgi:heme A synthase